MITIVCSSAQIGYFMSNVALISFLKGSRTEFSIVNIPAITTVCFYDFINLIIRNVKFMMVKL